MEAGSHAYVMTGPIVCKRCNATVTWARSRKGSPILMDFRPVDKGEYCIVGVDHPYRIVAKLAMPPTGALRYMCHFDTCANPNPRYFRSRPGPRRKKSAYTRSRV